MTPHTVTITPLDPTRLCSECGKQTQGDDICECEAQWWQQMVNPDGEGIVQ